MPELTAAELNPLVHGLDRLTDETTPAGAELSRQVEIDEGRGAVRVDIDSLKRHADEVMPEKVSDGLVSATKDVVGGGAAVFKDELAPRPAVLDPDSPPPVDDGRRVVPWVVVSDLIQTLRGTPAPMREALGVDSARDGEEAARLLRAAFPNAPDFIMTGAAADLLAREPEVNLSASLAAFSPAEGTVLPRPNVDGTPSLQTSAAANNEYLDCAMGIVKGDWSGLGGHWWGWPFGWSVAISGPTAATLANLLLGVNGGGKLFDAVVQAVKARGVSAGVKSLSLTAGAAIMLYAVALGLNIRAVNGRKGVRLQGNWPVIGGPGAFVWATKP